MPYPAQVIAKFEIEGKQYKFSGTLSEPIKRLGNEAVLLSYEDPALLADAESFAIDFRDNGFGIMIQNGVSIQGSTVSAEVGRVINGNGKWDVSHL